MLKLLIPTILPFDEPVLSISEGGSNGLREHCLPVRPVAATGRCGMPGAVQE
jgi:hypothetical protein